MESTKRQMPSLLKGGGGSYLPKQTFLEARHPMKLRKTNFCFQRGMNFPKEKSTMFFSQEKRGL
jgi:hypothetical protein